MLNIKEKMDIKNILQVDKIKGTTENLLIKYLAE